MLPYFSPADSVPRVEIKWSNLLQYYELTLGFVG